MLGKNILKIAKTIHGSYQPEGDGAMVMRFIGTQQLKSLDPFLMLGNYKL